MTAVGCIDPIGGTLRRAASRRLESVGAIPAFYPGVLYLLSARIARSKPSIVSPYMRPPINWRVISIDS